MDVTERLGWLLSTLHRAVDQAQRTLDAILTKARFWQRWATMPLTERQVKLLNRMLDGFEGKLTNSKWATGHPVFAGHGPVRHQRPACAGRTVESRCGRAKHQLRTWRSSAVAAAGNE